MEESEDLVKYSKKYSLNQVFIVSPITTDERMKKINKICSGYVYLVSMLGTTGKRDKISTNLDDLIKRTKDNIDLPVYVGFGISKPEHVNNIFNKGADGTICGSAFCELIENNLNDPDKMTKEVGKFCHVMQNFK